jgi:hypothetical protein
MSQLQLTLDFQQYEALVYLAREGSRIKGFMDGVDKDPRLRQLAEAAHRFIGNDVNGARNLEAFLKSIEVANGVVRHYLAIRWTELEAPLPPRVAGAPTRFPENWPPNLQGSIELLTRSINRADVDNFLSINAQKPINVMVTTDTGLQVGWTLVDDFFV